jgi:GntR family transcriptional regulator
MGMNASDIAVQLQSAIQRQEYPVGGGLPTEAALCERFGASRYTVRQALGRLSKLGMIERKQGSGSVVRATEPQISYAQSMGSLDELMQYAKDTVLTVDRVRLEPAGVRTAQTIGGAVGENWLHVSGRRHSVGRRTAPIAWTDIYINPRFRAVENHLENKTVPVYRLIEELFDETVDQVEQDITATLVMGRMATKLQLTPGQPGLRVIRRYLGRDQAVLAVAVNVHPAGRFRYSMVLNRSVGR